MHVTPSLLRAHLECEHRTHMDSRGDPARRRPVSDFQRMLWEEGLLHERSFFEEGELQVVDLSGLSGDEKEAATRAAIAYRAPLIYQGRLTAPGLVGEPDLLRREDDGYVPIDIKSGRALEDDGGPKIECGVQIALYVDLLERIGVSPGPYGFIWDRQRTEVRYGIDETITEDPAITLRAKYLALRIDAEKVLRGELVTEPAACAACEACPWKDVCHEALVERDDLTVLPELGRAKREVLRPEFPTVAALANADVERYVTRKKTAFAGIGPDTLRALQVRAQVYKAPGRQPRLLKAVELPAAPVELFFDIEDDPLRGRCYLHGFVIREDGDERYVGLFADETTAAAEEEAFAQAMAVFRQYPQALVLHYSPHEKTYYRELASRYPRVAAAPEIEALFAAGRAVDLLPCAKKVAWGTSDHSVKTIAQSLGFAWRDENPSGAASVEWFHRYTETGNLDVKRRILEYNEDDCRAMRVVSDAVRTIAAGEQAAGRVA